MVHFFSGTVMVPSSTGSQGLDVQRVFEADQGDPGRLIDFSLDGAGGICHSQRHGYASNRHGYASWPSGE
jgi:hypothetical protein